jgi:YaiO family outer membrane protein
LALWAAASTCALAQTAEPPATLGDAPLALRMSGNLELGVMHQALSGSYQDWRGEFARLTVKTDPSDTWLAEVAQLDEFGDHGVLVGATNTHDINPDLFLASSLSTSSGGFFLPRLRWDEILSFKLGDRQEWVPSVGFSAIDSKDSHSDRALTLGVAYYFTTPLVLEGGGRFNDSTPGAVHANSYYVAATYGTDKVRYVSARFGFGREAYEVIGPNSVISDFRSHEASALWKEWIWHDSGLQLRINAYQNPYYRRNGGELSWFCDF